MHEIDPAADVDEPARASVRRPTRPGSVGAVEPAGAAPGRRPRRRWCRSGLPGQWGSASASGAMYARGRAYDDAVTD